MKNVKYDYSSVHVDVPNKLANNIMDWGKLNICDDTIYVTHKDPTFGREDQIHITILYGLHTDTPEPVRNLIEKTGPVKIKLGKTSIFTDPYKFDVVIIEAFSDELKELNKQLVTLKHTSKYGNIYRPHVTIAYVKKGKGWKFQKWNTWEGMEFECNYAIFSSKNGSKDKILL